MSKGEVLWDFAEDSRQFGQADDLDAVGFRIAVRARADEEGAGRAEILPGVVESLLEPGRA